jgi:hypothetical protein
MCQSGKAHRKQQIRNTMENKIKELELKKTYKYLGVEDSRNTKKLKRRMQEY